MKIPCRDCGSPQKRNRMPSKGYAMCFPCWAKREGLRLTAKVENGTLVIGCQEAKDKEASNG